jgi:beta-glucosidase
MGFIGDKNENLLWRIRHGELEGTSPKLVILHIGSENLRAGESPERTLEGILYNVRAIHIAVPNAKVAVLAPLEDVPRVKELKSLLRQAIANDTRADYMDLSEAYRTRGTAALEEAFL